MRHLFKKDIGFNNIALDIYISRGYDLYLVLTRLTYSVLNICLGQQIDKYREYRME